MIQRMSQLLRVDRPGRKFRSSRRTQMSVAAAEALEGRILLSACSVAPCAPKCNPAPPKDCCSTSKCSSSSCGGEGQWSHGGCCTPPSTPTCNSHDICGQLEAIFALISGCGSSQGHGSSCGNSNVV